MTSSTYFYSGLPKRRQHDVSPGTVLSHERYVINGVLGCGGYSHVFSADDSLLGRGVALKIAGGERVELPVANSLLVREAFAYRAIGGHEHIWSVYDVVEERNFSPPLVGIAMMKSDFGSLRDWLVLHMADYETRVRQGKQLFKQMCKGVSHAHKHDVVHGDIKPENFLFSSPHCVRLADFGAAQSWRNPDAQFVPPSLPFFVGTPEYMPISSPTKPETADKTSDIFALGVIAHEIFSSDCSRPPRHFMNGPGQHTECLRTLTRKGIPEKIARVILRCLEKRK